MMLTVFKNYSNEVINCFSFKGTISNRRLIEYLIINWFVMSGITSFLSGVYDGFNDVSTTFNWTIFIVFYAATVFGVITKRIRNSESN